MLNANASYWKASLALLASPLLAVAMVAPESFALGWNQGRAGFVFGFIFLLVEIYGLEAERVHRKRIMAAIGATLASILYLTTQGLFQTQRLVELWGETLRVALIYSWIWMWDYAVYLVNVLVVLVAFFRWRNLRFLLTGPIYLGGMFTILALDAGFPYAELGPLQAVVPHMLNVQAVILRLLAIGDISVSGNILTIVGAHGPFSLAVFWPSAGVHSIIIYSLVMGAFLAKLPLSKSRWIRYFLFGVVGTVAVNMLRILLLAIYVGVISANPSDFEAFHATAGEALFLPWLASYLLLVNRLARGKISTVT
jgi:thaumarchaeosortase